MLPSEDAPPITGGSDFDPRYPPHDQERFEADYHRRRAAHEQSLERTVNAGD